MKKYLLITLPYVVFVTIALFFLQNPHSSFAIGGPPQQQKTISETCTCYTANVAGYHKNWYHCGPVTTVLGNAAPKDIDSKQVPYVAVGSCSHQEEYCLGTPGASIDPQNAPFTGGSAITYKYTGVSCQTVSKCACGIDPTTKKSEVQCYSPINGQPTKYIAGDSKSQAQSFQCDSGKTCEDKPGVNDSGFSYLNRPVTGVACVSKCHCYNPNKTGNGNNGWWCENDSQSCLDGSTCNQGKCKDGSKCASGSCPNREDYCSNTPSGTQSVSCVNSSKCTCNSDKSEIDCVSKGSGDNGADEKQPFKCAGPGLCTSGPSVDDPGFSFANQHITGIKCMPPGPPTPLPPPPSPPCKQWASTGQCSTFNSTFGGFATDPQGFIQKIFAILLSVSGGIALLLIMRAGYNLMTAQGNPEKLNNAREQLVAAIVGLIFLIFSFVFLEAIGYDILRIPGFK